MAKDTVVRCAPEVLHHRFVADHCCVCFVQEPEFRWVEQGVSVRWVALVPVTQVKNRNCAKMMLISIAKAHNSYTCKFLGIHVDYYRLEEGANLAFKHTHTEETHAPP